MRGKLAGQALKAKFDEKKDRSLGHELSQGLGAYTAPRSCGKARRLGFRNTHFAPLDLLSERTGISVPLHPV